MLCSFRFVDTLVGVSYFRSINLLAVEIYGCIADYLFSVKHQEVISCLLHIERHFSGAFTVFDICKDNIFAVLFEQFVTFCCVSRNRYRTRRTILGTDKEHCIVYACNTELFRNYADSKCDRFSTLDNSAFRSNFKPIRLKSTGDGKRNINIFTGGNQQNLTRSSFY